MNIKKYYYICAKLGLTFHPFNAKLISLHQNKSRRSGALKLKNKFENPTSLRSLLGSRLTDTLQKRWMIFQVFLGVISPLMQSSSLMKFLGLLFMLVKVFRRYAYSYRQFRVGAILIEDLNLPNPRIFGGSNVKINLFTQPQCAELRALAKARRHKCKKISIIITCGPPQHDDRSGNDTLTLHPCGYCRETLRHLLKEGLVGLDTLIVTLHPFRTFFEVQTVEQLLRLHGHIK
jgi:cytidine deaminase